MAINVRDVLRSGVLTRLLDAGVDVHVFSTAAEEAHFKTEFGALGAHLHTLRAHPGGPFTYAELITMKLHALIQSLRCATLEIRMADTLRRNGAARGARWVLKAIGRGGQDHLLAIVHSVLQRLAPRGYDAALRDLRPDLVIGTRVLSMTPPSRPEGSRALDRHLLLAAARRGIPTMVLVASWDNLTTGGFFPVAPTRITVWNEIMKREAIEVQGVPAERIVVTGAPQHDPYADPAVGSSRTEFFERMGLELDRPLVVYTTQTTGTVPDEPAIAARIADVLESRFGGRVQLLVRLHQLDRRDRFDALKERAGVTLDQAGRSIPGYDDRDFDADALRDLVDTLRHADVVVNTASSIAIDATAIGSPVVCVRFDAEDERPYERSVRRLYDFTHLANVVESGGVVMVDSPEALADQVALFLADPSANEAGRASLLQQQCYRVDGGSAKRVADAVLEVLG